MSDALFEPMSGGSRCGAARERLAPEAHFFIRSKHPWIQLPPGVSAFETLGDPAKRGYGERVEAALAKAGLSAFRAGA